MIFELYDDKLDINDSTWLDRGYYRIIRKFDHERWLIDTNAEFASGRQLTLVYDHEGEAVND